VDGAGRGALTRRAGPVARLAAVLVAGPALAAPAPLCPPGRFVVHQGERLIAGAAGTYDVIRIADGRVSLVGACPPAPVHLRARRAGTRLRSRWPRRACGTDGRVRLRASVADGCQVLRGVVRTGGVPPVAVVASRCADDGVLGPGETCAGPDACAPGEACVDCRCVPRPAFARDVLPLLSACLGSACHVGDTAPGGFDLSPAAAYATLRGRLARAGPCAGLPLVAAGRPDDSVLFERISGTRCGTRMPNGSTALAPAQVDAIRAWIASGAAAD
jgi:hypothetical protein